MRTALVIGGTGQVGRAVVPALVGDGWAVRVLSRGSRADAATVEAWGAHGVVGDRRDPEVVRRALHGGVDVVVDVVGYDDRDAVPLLAHRGQVGSAVVVSSAAVYVDDAGDGLETDRFGTFPVPLDESRPTVDAGRDTYATGKVALERAWLHSPVPTTALRAAAIHGPGCVQPREWTFVRRVLDGRDVRVLAHDGESRFQTVATAVLAELVRLAAARPGDRVLNAADPDAPTVAEIARVVDATLGAQSRTVTFPGPPRGNLGLTPWSVPHPLVLDMTRAASELGYVAPGSYAVTAPAAVHWLVDEASRRDWRDAFPGFVRMEAMGDFFDYAAEDAFLAAGAGARADDPRA
ncbi:NAD-dependent epimerase/dehydratase family protein [Cellulomonas fimi]|uniref:NAD-dependent epimerase/dehydratase n=1 Tax=Cellulomonas fimi (strain ATCC 484 / DSM 20113 / JCM 1341 / CCUG 24087 / LMG 16345 / NBRC 15513 / NCIMB 8980 / NCTC 7547 / NRS-133) TaxID=590998 RepID=F4GYB4_CELFA|nr:NAD(P)-dependent oxidoreductase [Cellulomonas fimi]AEE45903.1 NAD-dependent epimerase/dehydratase [Cellulomonas fimi ATCC 484]NNH06770.1 NAD(P)-dependent oxidoreductase [Cellulomonas fimi]VEH30949.1 Putative NADH-flavin reductase [Cellulomonas fimi]